MRRIAALLLALVLSLSVTADSAQAARRSWASTIYLSVGSAVVSSMPMTFCAWAKTSVTGTLQALIHIGDTAVGPTQNRWSLTVDTADKVTATTNTTTGTVSAVTSTTISASTWFHACATFTSATSRAAYLNGGGKGTNTTSRSPASVDTTAIGVLFGSSITQPCGPAGTCDIAWPTIWSVALSDAEVAILATGVDPRLIQPEDIVAFWPLDGNSPENNLVNNGTNLTVTGALTTSASAPLFRAHK